MVPIRKKRLEGPLEVSRVAAAQAAVPSSQTQRGPFVEEMDTPTKMITSMWPKRADGGESDNRGDFPLRQGRPLPPSEMSKGEMTASGRSQ